MIDPFIDQFVAGGWLYAALRVAFVALIYGFLFLVLRATARELSVAARAMAADEGHVGAMSLRTLDAAESSLRPGEALPLQSTTRIGRDPGNTMVIDDPHTSAKHAELRFERGQWWLRDLGSSNGTLVNGEPVRSVIGVRPGDVIQCGRVRFRLIPSITVPGGEVST
jgi:hypothetical protein